MWTAVSFFRQAGGKKTGVNNEILSGKVLIFCFHKSYDITDNIFWVISPINRKGHCLSCYFVMGNSLATNVGKPTFGTAI
jgi:hypothetical protein